MGTPACPAESRFNLRYIPFFFEAPLKIPFKLWQRLV
jgi:hypothetical protein